MQILEDIETKVKKYFKNRMSSYNSGLGDVARQVRIN